MDDISKQVAETVDLSPDALEPLIAALERGPEYVYRLVGTDQLAGRTMRALAARLAEVEAAKREMAMQALADLGQAQEAYEAQRAAEAELSRLRTAQDAMVGAAYEAAAKRFEDLWRETSAYQAAQIRALKPADATASLQRMLREARNAERERALGVVRRFVDPITAEDILAALVAQEAGAGEKGEE